MRTFCPIAKSEAPDWTSKWALISVPYQRGIRWGTKKTKISLGVVKISWTSWMRDILWERYLINYAAAENFWATGETRRAQPRVVVPRSANLDLDEDQRNVVGGRAFAPLGYAIEDAFFHFVEGQARGFADDFLYSFDAEHFAARTENVGDAVG